MTRSRTDSGGLIGELAERSLLGPRNLLVEVAERMLLTGGTSAWGRV